MARLFSSGFELQSVAAGIEWSAAGNAPAIETSTVRSGAASLRANASGEALIHQYTTGTPVIFIRAYLYIATLPSVLITFIRLRQSTNAKIAIRCNTTGTLELWNEEDTAQIGSDSAALNTGQWYRIELSYDPTTLSSTAVEAKIDGTAFASGTIDLAVAPESLFMGLAVSGGLTADFIYDDVAINDNSGSFQNTYPGEGEIIHLRPSAAGDNAGWNEGTGNTFAEVDEIIPDDVTTRLNETTAGVISDFNIDDTPAALAADDVINVVQVGMRFAQEPSNTGADIAIRARIKSAAAGTVENGVTQTTSTGYSTHILATPKNYQLTLYDLPGASTTAWDKSTLDTAQIGAELVTASAGKTGIVSTLWLLVDHKPGAGGAAATYPGYYGPGGYF